MISAVRYENMKLSKYPDEWQWWLYRWQFRNLKYAELLHVILVLAVHSHNCVKHKNVFEVSYVCIDLANTKIRNVTYLTIYMTGWYAEVAVFVCEVWLVMNYALWYEKLTTGLSNGAFTALKWQFDGFTMVKVLLVLLEESIFTALLVFLGTANVMTRIPLYLALFLPYTAGSFELTVVINVHQQENTFYFPVVLKP